MGGAAINATINYEDRFISNKKLIAISKSKRTANSDDVRQAYSAKDDGVVMPLFVRKNKDDKGSEEFYFLGTINAIAVPNEFVMPGTNSTAVEIEYELSVSVREDIYDYITHTSD